MRLPIEARAILRLGKSAIVLLLAAAVLICVAASRGFEYDEAYSVFVTSPTPRPAWPEGVFRAGDVRAAFTTHAGPLAIARALRATDVHPPLYFWMLAAWRGIAGDGLLRMRLLSVLCALGALAVVAQLARDSRISPALAMLLTLGCYGFAYTAAVARGFALAELLSLCGVLALSRTRRARTALGGGMLLGAATFANYLSAFTGCAALAWLVLWKQASPGRRRRLVAAGAGFAGFMPADLWFFLAQRGSRPGQFPPFQFGASLARMARYGAANLFGGLPLYVGATARPIAGDLLGLLALGLAAIVAARWRHMPGGSARWLFLLCAAATPVGLLLLGAAFDNTPIELRYLSFAMPFAALLLAGAIGSLRWGRALATGVLAIQALAIAGLIVRPETMQPARAVARASASLAGDTGVVLLPRGNDGVGVVGPVLAELPDETRVLLISPGWRPGLPRRRVVLAMIGEDEESRATLAAVEATLCRGTHAKPVLAVLVSPCPATSIAASLDK